MGIPFLTGYIFLQELQSGKNRKLQFNPDLMRVKMAEFLQIPYNLNRGLILMIKKQTEDHYQYLFEDAPIGIYRTTREGRVIDANKALVKMLGVPNFETLLDSNVVDFYCDPKDRQNFIGVLEHAGQVFSLTYQLRRMDGEIIWVQNTARAVKNKTGEVVYYEGVLEDISERVKAENELQITQARVESERAQRELAETLRDVANIITSTLDLEDVLQKILDNLRYLIPYDSAALILQEEDQLRIAAINGNPDAERMKRQIIDLKNDPLSEQIIKTREPIRIENAVKDPRFRNYGGQRAIRDWMGVPLISRGQAIGLLTLDNYTTNAYQEREVEIAFTFATQAAIAIENARLYAEEKQRAIIMSALRATLTDITSELDVQALLQSILVRAIQLLNATGGELALYDKEQNQVTIVACHNMGEDFTGASIKPGDGVLGKVALNGEPLLIHDYKTWEGHLSNFRTSPWRSVAAVPLEIHHRILGVIALAESTGEFDFTQADLHILTLFAQQAAIAIENAQLFDRISTALTTTETLYQTAQALITTENLNDLLQNLVERVASSLPADRVILITMNTETQTIQNYVIGGDREHLAERVSYQELMDGLTGWVMSEHQTAFSHFSGPDPREKPYVQRTREEYQAGSLIVVPMRYRLKILGTLTAIHSQGKDYSQADVELLETIASQAAIAITNAQLFEEIQQLAETDELTKINNRRQLFRLGEQAFNHAKRYNEPFAVIMLDIDNFKQVNDTYGHATGDIVLGELAQHTLENIREVDIVGRYGGEEFVIIMPNTTLEQGIEIAQRLRQQVENARFSSSAGAIKTTISLGLAALNMQTPNLAALIDRADTALYQAKNEGRNRVAFNQ